MSVASLKEKMAAKRAAKKAAFQEKAAKFKEKHAANVAALQQKAKDKGISIPTIPGGSVPSSESSSAPAAPNIAAPDVPDAASLIESIQQQVQGAMPNVTGGSSTNTNNNVNVDIKGPGGDFSWKGDASQMPDQAKQAVTKALSGVNLAFSNVSGITNGVPGMAKATEALNGVLGKLASLGK